MKKEVKQLIALVILVVIMVSIVYYFTIYQENNKKNVDMLDIPPKYSITSKNVNYSQSITGYLAKPNESGTYPGIIMIHEWWGLNENIKKMADELASQGYIVLAVDLYNGKVAKNSTEAGALAGSVRNNPTKAINNMKSAKTYLKNQGADKIASLGWCFGGGQSLQFTINEDVQATVIYYGNLVTNKSDLQKIDNPILGIFGSEDTSIPVNTVNEFDKSLDDLGIENEIHIYDGVGHAFANPSGANYAPEETKDAWIKTLAFLEKNL